MHLPSHLPSQQTPSMQLPLAHCLSHEQLDDWGRERVPSLHVEDVARVT